MIKGVIFDMDGVVSDTQKLHARVESEILSRFGIVIDSEEITERFAGVRTADFIAELLNQAGQDFDIDRLMFCKWEQMETLASKHVDPIPGSLDLIRRLYDNGYVLALASASNIGYVETVLGALGVRDRFLCVIGGDMVTKGKPDPESFLTAAAGIDVAPEQCLVIEDGRSGMEAAQRAGMHCVGLVKQIKKGYPTSHLVTQLSDVDDTFLASL